jgi:hypothetical protein
MSAPASQGATPARAVTVSAVPLLAATVLATCAVAWAAVPMRGAHPGARPVLAVAVACASLAILRLGAAMLASRSGAAFREHRLAEWTRSVLHALPWAEIMTVAVLALEALHPSRPWHTVALGVVVLAFLLVLHLAENGARPAVLRPVLPLIAAGLALGALSVVAAALSASGGLVAVIAASAAVAVAVLALPV